MIITGVALVLLAVLGAPLFAVIVAGALVGFASADIDCMVVAMEIYRIAEMPVLIAIPLLLQTYGIFAIAYASAKALKLPHNIAAPACLIGTSNFFELAVAVAISLFGLNSGAALATVVGVLVEVPVMLSLVAIANRTRHWFPA